MWEINYLSETSSWNWLLKFLKLITQVLETDYSKGFMKSLLANYRNCTIKGTNWTFATNSNFLLYINLACLSVCLFVSNKRQNGWTDRAQIFWGILRDPREGLWMIKFSKRRTLMLFEKLRTPMYFISKKKCLQMK